MKINVRIIFCLAVVIFCANISFAKEFSYIDKTEQKCLDNAQSAQQMLNCTNSASLMWENEIEKYYNLLFQTLDNNNKLILHQSQENWKKYKDKEFELIDTINDKDPTMFINIKSGFKKSIIKERAILLKGYYDTLNL